MHRDIPARLLDNRAGALRITDLPRAGDGSAG
jgi:hypothetical protein